MASLIAPGGRILARQCRTIIPQNAASKLRRAISTIPQNSHIYAHEDRQSAQKRYILSYLEETPPNRSLAIGTATRIPPTPDSFSQNDDFMKIVQWVIKDHAVDDPDVQAQAAMFASSAGSQLGSGGVFFPQQQQHRKRRQTGSSSGGGGGTGGDGAGGASSQGGMGGAGRGGYIHVSDQRNPPDFGRVAWPEDIFGSLEVDGEGKFVEPKGRYQEAGTYRMCTNEGVLELSPFLRRKLVERVKELDAQAKKNT